MAQIPDARNDAGPDGTVKSLGSTCPPLRLLERHFASLASGGGTQEAIDLLVAALGCSLDFYFVPEPRRFILYADHDEYTTLWAARKRTLSAIGTALLVAGFSEVSDYTRTL